MFDELPADDLSLSLRVRHIPQAGKKLFCPIKYSKIEMQLRCEGLCYLITFTGSQDAIIDEDAGELITDRPVRQRRRNRGIHAAAQRTDDSLLADLFTDLPNRGLDIGLHGPGRFAAANSVDEVAENFRSFRRVRHFWMELQAIDPALGIVPLHRRNGRVVRMRDRSKSRRHPFDAIAMRHPHGSRPIGTDSFEEILGIVDRQIGSAILAMCRLRDRPPGKMGHQLHAVANAEDRNILIEQFCSDKRRLLFVDTGRAAGKDDALRPICENGR